MSNTDPNSFAYSVTLRSGGTASSTFGKPSLSTDDAAARLISGHLWSSPGLPLTITYAYRRDGSPPDASSSGFQQFTSQQIGVAEAALQAWADVANVHFVRVNDGDGYSDNATILFGDYLSGPGAGYTVLPGSKDVSSVTGDIWINASDSDNLNPSVGNYGGLTLVHEIGHALGLQHPSAYDEDTPSLSFQKSAAYAQDTMAYSVMSYFTAERLLPYNAAATYPFSPRIDDITAIQRLYGANDSYHSGDDLYQYSSTALYTTSVIWDAGGTDTIDVTNITDGTIDLRVTGYVGGQPTIAEGVVIENLLGGPYMTLIGNNANNVLQAYQGNYVGGSHLFGEGGDDTLIGGGGDDVLDGGSGNNVIDGRGGNDILLLPGYFGDYVTTANSDKSYSIRGHGLTDTISNIEKVIVGDPSSGLPYPNGAVDLSTFYSYTTSTPYRRATHHYAFDSDFNGDTRSDLLIRNAAGELVAFQAVYGPFPNVITTNYLQATSPLPIDPRWSVIATLDWNGDGQSDILLRDGAGTIDIVQKSSSGGFLQDVYRSSAFDTAWSIAAVADLNADGKDDLIWRNRQGALSYWVSTGTDYQQLPELGPSMDVRWHIAATGDVNGDGYADLVWRNLDGRVATWLGSAKGFTAHTFFDGYADPTWQIVGLGDRVGTVAYGAGSIKGDGFDDLVWRNVDGRVTVWQSNGATFDTSSYGIDTQYPGADWSMGLVDANGDGRVDFLFSKIGTGTAKLAVAQDSPNIINREPAEEDLYFGTSTSLISTVPIDRAGQATVRGDFSGDGHSDMLWRNVSGALSTWTVAGNTSANQVQQGAYNGSLDMSWKVAETFDWNGDGRSDILWRQDSGALAVWASTGAGFNQGAYYRSSPVPTSWRIAGAGDLNGDGKDDILWQNADGSLSSWVSTGTGFQEAAFTHASAGNGWLVEALGDFNGDGRADILWRNTNGSVAVWTNTGQGTSFNEGAFYQPGVPTAWHVAAVGDVTGDGRDDIVWRNDDGQLTLWRANAQGGFDEGLWNAKVDTSWHIVQAGDFNDDGKADLLWRNDNGAVSTWQSNGQGWDQGIYNSAAPTSWTVAAHSYIL